MLESANIHLTVRENINVVKRVKLPHSKKSLPLITKNYMWK